MEEGEGLVSRLGEGLVGPRTSAYLVRKHYRRSAHAQYGVGAARGARGTRRCMKREISIVCEGLQKINEKKSFSSTFGRRSAVCGITIFGRCRLPLSPPSSSCSGR